MLRRLLHALLVAAGDELAPFVREPGDRLILLGLKERVANLEARMAEFESGKPADTLWTPNDG